MRVCDLLLKRWGLALLLIVFIADIFISICEGSWSVDNFPNPSLQPERCGFEESYCQSKTCLVCDPDGIMTSQEVVQLNEDLLQRRLQSECVCENGCDSVVGAYPIAIAVANQIRSSTGKYEPAVAKCHTFAQSLRSHWFDNHTCDDSSLIFFSFHYKELSLSLGGETESVFSDLELAALMKLSHNVLGEKAFEKSETSLSPNTTQTFIGLEQVLAQLHDGIANGPSMTSAILYSIVVPVSLVVLMAIMCLLANIWCRPPLEYSVDPKSGKHDVGHIVR